MRKLYFMLSMLLMQCIGYSLSAQTSSTLVTSLGEPLITDAAQITSNASDESEGQHLEYLIDNDQNTFWHSDWHGKVTDPHYLQVALTEPLTDGYIVMYLQRRNTDSNHFTQAKLSASVDGETWEDLASWELPNATALGEVVTDPIAVSKPYAYFRLTNTMASPIFFHLAEIELYNPKESDLIGMALNKILNKYDAYLYGDRNVMNVGTEVGQYTDGETADEILALLSKVIDWYSGENTEGMPATKEAAVDLSDEIDALYAKFKQSEVLYRLPADGYYRIISNLPYKQTLETGEVDANGHPITETNLLTKAMYCSTDYTGMWGNVKRDMANYVWKLTQTGDSIDMVNAGMEARFNIVAASVKLSEGTGKSMTFDYAGTEDGKTIVYIRASSDARGGDIYLHQNHHEKGTRVDDQPLCVWKGTIDMGAPYETDKGTSEWYLESVSEEEAKALIEAFAPIKNHDILVEQNNALRAEVKAAITAAKDKKRQALITAGSQMSSPFSQNDFGDKDGGNLADGVLIDGDANTYWHSVWSAGDVATGTHYIQVADMQEFTGEAVLYIKRRATPDNHVTEFTLKGSNDPEAADDAWVTLAVLPLGNASSGQEFTTEPFNVGETSYSHIRIYGSKNGFWHAAELQIYKLVDNPNSQFAALGELATNLEQIYLDNVATADDDITLEQFQALKDAFEAFRNGVVDPAALHNILAKYAGYTKGMIEGEQPGQWSDKKGYDAFNALYEEAKAYDEAGKYNQTKIDQYVAAIQLAADNYMATVNHPKADTWYRIKFPTEEMYDAYGWGKGNITGDDVTTPIYGNYIAVGKGQQIEGSAFFEYSPALIDSMREGYGLYALDNDVIEIEGEPNGSMFRFIKVNSPLKVNDDLNTLMQHSRLALAMTSDVQVGAPLITSASQFSSNAADESEGKYFEYLIDGDLNTYWHSDWHNRVTVPHYLQVTFDEPQKGLIEVDMTRRSDVEHGSIIGMYVTASNDGQEWTNLGYVSMPYGVKGEQIFSNPINLGEGYTQVRFTLTRRSGEDVEYAPFGDKCTYFNATEFQLRPVTITTTSEAAKALWSTLEETNKVLHNALGTTDYNTLAAAYNTLRDELNAGTHAVVPEAEATPARYVIQNRATGLFINTKAKNNQDVTLQLMPSLINYSGIGYGQNALRSENLDGTYCSYLHVQKNNHRMVTWDDKSVGSNTGLLIEEVEPVSESDFTFTKDIIIGKLNAWCYPVSIESDDEEIAAYSVAGLYTDAEENTFLALDKTESPAAGQPVIYVHSTPEDWIEGTEEEPTETTPVLFTVHNDFNFQAGTHNGLVGTLTTTHVATGTQTFVDNTVTAVKEEEGADVAACQAYLDLTACPQVEAADHDISIQLTDVTPDGIASAIESVSKSGNIYSIDGKLMRQGGTIDDVKRLGTGTYIINGVKVFVK